MKSLLPLITNMTKEDITSMINTTDKEVGAEITIVIGNMELLLIEDQVLVMNLLIMIEIQIYSKIIMRTGITEAKVAGETVAIEVIIKGIITEDLRVEVKVIQDQGMQGIMKVNNHNYSQEISRIIKLGTINSSSNMIPTCLNFHRPYIYLQFPQILITRVSPPQPPQANVPS